VYRQSVPRALDQALFRGKIGHQKSRET
jgi:hypothetical protein